MSKELLKEVKNVISEYSEMNMRLTIRQIYYRLVAAQLITNKLTSYQRVVRLLRDARLDGEVPFDAIEDRTREIHYPPRYTIENPLEYFNDYYEYVKALDERYSTPLWHMQPKRVFVLVEKQALSALFQQVTDKFGVPLIVCRGYPSLTLLSDIADEILPLPDKDIEVRLLYFGDFDPSGADIERHIDHQLSEDFFCRFDMKRIAITKPQIEDWNIPPAPAKTTDSRYEKFVQNTGVAWQVELDAIEPRQLQDLITTSLKEHWDLAARDARATDLAQRKAVIKERIHAVFKPECFEEGT